MLRKSILCALLLLLGTANITIAQKVTLDYFFNHEVHTVNGVTTFLKAKTQRLILWAMLRLYKI